MRQTQRIDQCIQVMGAVQQPATLKWRRHFSNFYEQCESRE
jgi:hypothetical protein